VKRKKINNCIKYWLKFYFNGLFIRVIYNLFEKQNKIPRLVEREKIEEEVYNFLDNLKESNLTIVILSNEKYISIIVDRVIETLQELTKLYTHRFVNVPSLVVEALKNKDVKNEREKETA